MLGYIFLIYLENTKRNRIKYQNADNVIVSSVTCELYILIEGREKIIEIINILSC